jgi:hypothetical protein
LKPPIPTEIALTSLLSAPLGSSRSKFLRMLSSPDIDRARRDARAATQASLDMLRRAVAVACTLADPHLTPPLLAWLLREEQSVGGQGQTDEDCGGGPDFEIERMILSLPRAVVDNAHVRAALQSSRCVRGALVSRLLQLQAGQSSWLHCVAGLGLRDIGALFWMYVRLRWSDNRPL